MTERVSKRVLVTGVNGAIGRMTALELRARGHWVAGMDLREPNGVDAGFKGSVVDFELVKKACAGVDAVVHLAAEVDDCDFVSRLVPSNVIGPYYLLQAAKEAGVRRVVLASSIQVISGLAGRKQKRVKVSDGCAPTNHYALAKVWQEEMGKMYARVHGLSVISVRIGWMVRDVREAERARAKPEVARGAYLSRGDAGRLFAACVESVYPGAGEEVTVNGVSCESGSFGLDGSDAVRLLGYEPRDTFPEGLPE